MVRAADQVDHDRGRDRDHHPETSHRSWSIRGSGYDDARAPVRPCQPSRSMIVALAMPPPSHIVWRP